MPDVLIANGTIANGTMSVPVGATQIPTSPLANRTSVTIYNNGPAAMYVGGAGVNSNNGIPVGSAGSIVFQNLGNSPIYAVAPGTVTIRVMEIAQY